MPSRRLGPIFFMGAFAIAYVLVRPLLDRFVPHLIIWEFPVGAILVAYLIWRSLRRRAKEPPPVEWRRHRQVVRALPDPAMASDLRALERWVETGAEPERVADILARGSARDATDRDARRESLAREIQLKGSRVKRESFLKETIGA